MISRRQTPSVQVGNVLMGSAYPVVIQSMTNTQTADIKSTVTQIKQLVDAGAELVRVTVNTEDAIKAIPEIESQLNHAHYNVPIIGDFHFNGHILLQKYPKSAQILSKYRVNPGNVRSLDSFKTMIQIAKDNQKPIRIGVNAGSIDPMVIQSLQEKYQDKRQLMIESAVQSALKSAEFAESQGLRKDYLILSIKMSDVQDMIAATQLLAKRCDYVLHLGLTEAGSGLQGITASAAALGVLLQQGVGDTIRVSLTPEPGTLRIEEVHCCKAILQGLGIRYFSPRVTSCPGCGRTNNQQYIQLSSEIKKYIDQKLFKWKSQYKGIEKLHIAVMGCVVNGPGESKNADIGISLPGYKEEMYPAVYIGGKHFKTIKEKNVCLNFIRILESFIEKTYR